MRISDWSSDVCSSDLLKPGDRREPVKYRTDARGRTLLPGFIGLDGDVMEAGRLPPSPENERFRDNPVELEAVLTRAQERLAAAGITTASDLGTSRSEEHTSELQSLMRISYAVFWLQI